MLGKLIKNEFKATSRTFILLYVVMLVVTVFLKIMIEIQNHSGAGNSLVEILFGFLMVTFVIAVIGLLLGTFILIIKRFYDNMLKDEGYLSFTLPVTTGQHIASKSIVSYIWVVATVSVIGISILVLMIGDGGFYTELIKTIREGIKIINQEGWWLPVIELILIMLIGTYSTILMAYTCLSVGQIMNKHRILGAFLTYLVLYVINQLINSVFMAGLLGIDIDQEMSIVSGFFQPYMIYLLVYTVVEAVIFTVVTHLMLSKRLNLE